MKLYNGLSPNGFRVAAFMFEKDIKLPTENVDVMKGEARQTAHLARNSLGEIPVLELDDGSYLSESVAICRYLETQYPAPPLMGTTAEETAIVEMWNRRMEQQIFGTCGNYGLHVIPFFADKVEQMPDYAESQVRMMAQKWRWLEGELADGRPFIAGDSFSIADITGMAALMIHGFLEALEIPTDLVYVHKWAKSVQSRPCAAVFSDIKLPSSD